MRPNFFTKKFFSMLALFCMPICAAEGQADLIASASDTIATVSDVKIIKHGCYFWDVYVSGKVISKAGRAPVSGALVTGSMADLDDVDFVQYFDHYSYAGGYYYYYFYPNGLNISRAISDYSGFYELRFDVCYDADAWNWSADFNVCAEKEGFMKTCDRATFDEDDWEDDLDLEMPAGMTPTPTLTPLPSSTPTPTPTLSATVTYTPVKTATPTIPPEMQAAHPEFDADQDGVISSKDLFLFLQDWKKRSKP